MPCHIWYFRRYFPNEEDGWFGAKDLYIADFRVSVVFITEIIAAAERKKKLFRFTEIYRKVTIL